MLSGNLRHNLLLMSAMIAGKFCASTRSNALSLRESKQVWSIPCIANKTMVRLVGVWARGHDSKSGGTSSTASICSELFVSVSTPAEK